MSEVKTRVTTPLEGGPTFSFGHRCYRAIWNTTWLLLAAWTPPPLHRWRGWLLRAFGADVHPKARVYGSVRVWYPPNLIMRAHAVLGPRVNCYCMDRITIAEKAVISQDAYLCCGTHDIRDLEFRLVTRPIFIGPRAWVAADAFIGPGVAVHEGSVVGARAVLFRDAEPYGVYSGNPAVLIKHRVFRESA